MLYSRCWDPDAVRDDVRDHLIEQLGDPAGVLIADETGFVKKGVRSAGVQRQYTGTTGKVDNCQIGTILFMSGLSSVSGREGDRAGPG